MFNVQGDSVKIVGQMMLVMCKKDLGATFANIATELAKYTIDSGSLTAIAIMENTNGTGAGVRLYVYAPGTGWKYAALS